jgi:hypothetical protein
MAFMTTVATVSSHEQSQMARIIAIQSQNKKHTHSHLKFQIQRFQSIHKDDKITMASDGVHYGAAAREKNPQRTPTSAKHPLTKHLRSQHENQKRLFQRNPTPSERR